MKALVTYGDDKSIVEIKIKRGTETIGYADMDGSTAVLTTVYPWDAAEGITGEQCLDVLDYLKSLPFVQAATFGDSNE